MFACAVHQILITSMKAILLSIITIAYLIVTVNEEYLYEDKFKTNT